MAARKALGIRTQGSDVYRATFGLKETMKADQGLLMAWGGFKGTVRKEARGQHFSMLLWDADDLIDALFESYDRIRDDIRSKLPLQRTWVPVQNGTWGPLWLCPSAIFKT